MLLRTCLPLLLLPFTAMWAQHYEDFRDSLHDSSADFRTRCEKAATPKLALAIAKMWLANAKRDRNYIAQSDAYQWLLYSSDKTEDRFAYSDSVIYASKKTGQNEKIGASYLTRGSLFYNEKKHIQALDHFLIADQYIARCENPYLSNKLKYAIAQTKKYLGFDHEAIALFKECAAYFEDENDRAYLNTIHNLAMCYTNIGDNRLCTAYTQIGLTASLDYEDSEMHSYFMNAEGVNQYFLNNYDASLRLLQSSLPMLLKKKDFANEIRTLFYMGKANHALGNTAIAFDFFDLVDKQMRLKQYIRPDLRENFELLIDRYRSKKNLEKELYYVNGLIAADSALFADFKYLSQKIEKNYDTKALQQEKSRLEHTLFLTKTIYVAAFLLLLTILFFIVRHYRIKVNKLKLTFERIFNETATKEHDILLKKELNIAPEVIDELLKNLKKFEEKKKYLERDLGQIRLADILHSNIKYVRQVIFQYRGKKTFTYINDLKIDHIVLLLKNEKRFRKYTNQALADEAGFGSVQNFTKAFAARTGTTPGHFIQELVIEIEGGN
ncbi:helix-turn-helix domain-containing protein [Flavobacterium qiangtangense]|uniref:Helix-turn-helix domain-containing protein n=1 Tax=Flavobacterium qiangtangense TaxID=1442595 RepID=A0ABW1PLM2_9FLAO